MDEQELRGILSSNIKRCRTRANLSQTALAEKLDISTNFLSDIERCKAWVSPLTLVKIASALDIEPYELFKADELFSDDEKDILKKYAEENLNAVISIMNKLRNP
ncbi:MAG: helix-turn-helix domain-containing protein [Spirochaetales bacterium]|jgi:transcriptional regulator with XRE-family HTH domain|nr:helix-turn-helix domain-containing protein [Spirochaetales bacterium]